MRKLIAGLIIGFVLASASVYALRVAQPPKITKLDASTSARLDIFLNDIWDITNGRYQMSVKTSAPAWTGKEGEAVAYSLGGDYRLYIYINDGWRYWVFDG